MFSLLKIKNVVAMVDVKGVLFIIIIVQHKRISKYILILFYTFSLLISQKRNLHKSENLRTVIKSKFTTSIALFCFLQKYGK